VGIGVSTADTGLEIAMVGEGILGKARGEEHLEGWTQLGHQLLLGHLAADEPLLLAFAAENAIDPGEVIKAHDTIAGRSWERDMS